MQIPFIDYSLCVGCGACSETFPALFVLHDDRAWVQNHESFDPEDGDRIIAVCIYGAISIEGPGEDRRSHNAPASRGRGGKRGR